MSRTWKLLPLATVLALSLVILLPGTTSHPTQPKTASAACTDTTGNLLIDITDISTGDRLPVSGSVVLITPDPLTGSGEISVTDDQSPDILNTTPGLIRLTGVCIGITYNAQLLTLPAPYDICQYVTPSASAPVNTAGVVTLSLDVDCTDLSLTTASSVTIYASLSTLVCGATEPIAVLVEDIDGNPVAGAPVVLSASSGSLSPTSGTTDSDGRLFALFSAPDTGGTSIITASAGGTASGTLTVAINCSSAPTITASGESVSAVEGTPLSDAKVATVSYANPAATPADLSASIDWGDGTALDTGTISGPAGGPFDVAGNHTYAEEGSYTVTTVITDANTPTNTATATSMATAADAALSSTWAGPTASNKSVAGVLVNLNDANPGATTADFSASIEWGDGSALDIGTMSGPAGGPFTVSGSHSYEGTGPFVITVTTTDDGDSTTIASGTVLVYQFVSGGGAFVVGDKSDTGSVNFWGAKWWKLNSLSGGAAPAAFMGFAKIPALPTCGTHWSTDPGNSSQPPIGPLPAYMGVIVSPSVTQSGSAITGTAAQIMVVRTDSGYQANPGHAGTGTVVLTVCR